MKVTKQDCAKTLWLVLCKGIKNMCRQMFFQRLAEQKQMDEPCVCDWLRWLARQIKQRRALHPAKCGTDILQNKKMMEIALVNWTLTYFDSLVQFLDVSIDLCTKRTFQKNI